MTTLAITDLGEVIQADKARAGFCWVCGGELVPKVGEVVSAHWAHRPGEAHDCPIADGIDPDEYTGWHIAIQHAAKMAGARTEVAHATGRHRADIVCPDGLVVEVQHSRIDVWDVRSRNRTWGGVWWLWDGPECGCSTPTDETMRLSTRRLVVDSASPTFIDWRGTVWQVIEADGEVPCAAKVVNCGLSAMQWVAEVVAGERAEAWSSPVAIEAWQRSEPSRVPVAGVLGNPRHAVDVTSERFTRSVWVDLSSDDGWNRLAAMQAERGR